MENIISFSDKKNDWNAQWIWNEENSPGNTWMCFRKTIHLETIPTHATAFIATDSKYYMWINGDLIVFEGGLNRGPKLGAGYYDEVSLDGHLKQGTNTIAILVWYWGNEGRNSVDSGAGGLLFQAEVDSTIIISDYSWKASVHPAYKQTQPPYPAYLYAGHNIGFDASLDISDWNTCNFDDSKWKFAADKGASPCMPWGELFSRPIPLVKYFDIKYYSSISISNDGDSRVYIANLPHAAHITPVFKINAKRAGLMIDIRTDRYEVKGGPGDTGNTYRAHRTEYFTREGIQDFESLDWLFGEQVIYTFPLDVEVLGVQFHETGYDVDFAGSFKCNDIFLNTLYEKCKRTLYICMRDNYMDCPDRERGQWIGDVSSQVPQTFYALGRSADKLTKKAIRDFVNWRAGKILRGNVPGVHCSELPSQSLNAISENGMIMSYYMHSGDVDAVFESYDAVKDYLLLWEFDQDGTVIPRAGNWYWFDHGDNIDSRVLENAWYYSTLKAARKMAELTGNLEDINEFQKRIDLILDNFDRLFWDGVGYKSGDFYDDRANAMVVLSGLASSEKWPGILEILNITKNSTPYMEGYVLEAMFTMNYVSEAIKRMEERYYDLVTNCNTTLWEDFTCLGTRNHAWTGGPLTILAKYVAGIAPETAGYETYNVMPQSGKLTSFEITVPSVKGKIHVNMSRTSDEYRLHLTSLSGTTATVGIPKNIFVENTVKCISCGTFVIWENGQYVGNTLGANYKGENDQFIMFTVEPGIWDFTAISR